MRDIIFFSNNKNKIKEISNLFSTSNFKMLSLNDYKKIKSPLENGISFAENAKIKSLYGYKYFKKICFADDSGLCIEAMENNPGIHSKDFLNKYKKKEDALQEIINLVTKKNNFNAYFQTSICLTINLKKHIFFNGRVKGYISKKIIDVGAFGYDPIFIPSGGNKTFSQMDLEEKNKISHRYIAVKKLNDFLVSLFF